MSELDLSGRDVLTVEGQRAPSLVAAVLIASVAVVPATISARLVTPRVQSFVSVPRTFIAQCRSTAKAVGYPVPCPTRVPPGFNKNQDGAAPGCSITIVCPAPSGRWVLGESASATQHLIIRASPRPVASYLRFVDWPAGSAHVKALGWLSIKHWRVRIVFVSTLGSAFAHHVVLMWTVGGHTYGVGFHDFTGLQRTLLLDKELIRSVSLIGP